MNRLLSIYKLTFCSVNISRSFGYKTSIFLDNGIMNSVVRWKSKGRHTVNVKNISRNDVVPEALSLLKVEKMDKEFQNILLHFQSSLVQRLSLRMTLQTFSDITLSEGNVKLGQVANLLQQNASHQNITSGAPQNRANLGDQFLLVDLSGRPDLFVSARKAVISFLDPSKDGSGESLIEPTDHYAFTIRLNTIITQECRNKAIAQGKELLHQAIHEMDKVYQTHNKLLNSKQAKEQLSEDNLFIARQYLRTLVKEQHNLVETLWNKKKTELEG
ncbi:unnamed protein product [Heterobilharzia americana]|nr:unnamed protein product [Heterobilharzia americana]CAH8622326.1 unnamed protein product [Heterobilharzia americana]